MGRTQTKFPSHLLAHIESAGRGARIHLNDLTYAMKVEPRHYERRLQRRAKAVGLRKVGAIVVDGPEYDVEPLATFTTNKGKFPATLVRKLIQADPSELDHRAVCQAMDHENCTTQVDHGRCGGMLAGASAASAARYSETELMFSFPPAGRLGPNRYVGEYSKDGRSKCKLHECKRVLELGEFRIGKIPPRARAVKTTRVHWYHPACLFTSFDRVAKFTKCLDAIDELEGFESLKTDDQLEVEDLLEQHARRGPVKRRLSGACARKPRRRKASEGGDFGACIVPRPLGGDDAYPQSAASDDDDDDFDVLSSRDWATDDDLASASTPPSPNATVYTVGSETSSLPECAPFFPSFDESRDWGVPTLDVDAKIEDLLATPEGRATDVMMRDAFPAFFDFAEAIGF